MEAKKRKMKRIKVLGDIELLNYSQLTARLLVILSTHHAPYCSSQF
jgi:hypothetical protein